MEQLEQYQLYRYVKLFSESQEYCDNATTKEKTLSCILPADRFENADGEDLVQSDDERETVIDYINPRSYENLGQNERSQMKVDEILALYLFRLSNRVNANYYKKVVLPFVILFRECLNDCGWEKQLGSQDEEKEKGKKGAKEADSKEFCMENNAEHAPEICNEFITVYLEQRMQQWNFIKQNMHYNANDIIIPEINKAEQIDLTINLCHWLFECQFTCSKLSLIA